MEFVVIGQALEAGFIEMIKLFGLPTCLVIWFVIQSHRDKTVLEKRLNGLEDFCRNEFVSIAKENTKALTENTKALEDAKEIINHVRHKL